MKKTKLLLFAFFILLFTNCEKEIYDDAIQANKKDFTFKTITFKELNKIDKKAASKIIELKTKKDNNFLDKTSEMYGFLVDTTSIINIERDNGFSSFSFKIEQSNSLSNFKNIVIENYPDGSQRVLAIKFNLTKPLLLLNTNNIANATTSVEVINLSENNGGSNRGSDCITVGYWTTVDACEGEVDIADRPRCLNADGSRATREIFITLAEGCSEGGDGGFNGNPSDTNGSGYYNGSDSGGGDINGYGIFIPNLYTGDEDPNNAEFVLAGQVANYFNALPQNIKSLTNNNNWVYAYLVDYFRNNGNGVTARNTPKATAALNNYYNFQLNSYSPSISFLAHERLNFWAYYTFLNNNPANINTQAVFNIRDYIIQAAQNDESIVDYLFNNFQSQEALEFVKWQIDYLNNHPNVTLEQFKNWFLTPREGKDFFYDAEYWENPNLSFIQQDLPSWDDFDLSYPRMDGADLVVLVGGAVKTAYDTYPSLSRGYCALKVSRGLNYAGITIPQITTTSGNPGTVLGGDGLYYFLNAKALNKWMRETFGTNPATTTTPLNTNHVHIDGSEGGNNGENFPDLVDGIKGIYSLVSTNSQWASGHADLINEGECPFGCHFYDDPPAPIDYIDIWKLD